MAFDSTAVIELLPVKKVAIGVRLERNAGVEALYTGIVGCDCCSDVSEC